MSPDAHHTQSHLRTTLKDARTQPMPAKTNDQNPFGEGDLNQELIDQMLNGGDSSGTVQPDPWAAPRAVRWTSTIGPPGTAA